MHIPWRSLLRGHGHHIFITHGLNAHHVAPDIRDMEMVLMPTELTGTLM